MQSIEHALRTLDKSIAEESERLARSEKMLLDFQAQLGKDFEHEARLKELLAQQAQLNAALDLDKGERQVAPSAPGDPDDNDDPPSAYAEASADKAPRRARETPRARRIFKPPTLRPGL